MHAGSACLPCSTASCGWPAARHLRQHSSANRSQVFFRGVGAWRWVLVAYPGETRQLNGTGQCRGNLGLGSCFLLALLAVERGQEGAAKTLTSQHSTLVPGKTFKTTPSNKTPSENPTFEVCEILQASSWKARAVTVFVGVALSFRVLRISLPIPYIHLLRPSFVPNISFELRGQY